MSKNTPAENTTPSASRSKAMTRQETKGGSVHTQINVDIVDSTQSTFEVDSSTKSHQPPEKESLDRSQTKVNTTMLITLSVTVFFLILGMTVYIAATWQAARLGERYLYGNLNDYSCTGDICLLIPATEKEVNSTQTFFSAGEEITDLYDAPLLIKDEARSTPHLQRYQAVYKDEENRRALGSLKRSLNGDAAAAAAAAAADDADDADADDDYHSGVTMILSPEDQSILYEDHLEVLEGGYATLGEYADKNGQVGDRVLRTQVKIMSGNRSGDRFFLVPLGFSMTGYDNDNYTIARRPELFYFSYIPNGTAIEDRLVSICMEANFKADLNNDDVIEDTIESHCFLGHGDEHWGEVQKYANAWFTADMADGGGFVDTPFGSVVYEDEITDDVGNEVVDGTGTRRNLLGYSTYRKAGALVGKELGSRAGGAGGAVVGGACCGPIGAVVGRKVGAWAGGKAGAKAGSYVGGKVSKAVKKLGGRRRRRRRKRL